jgi:CheY-like chemotaxis protein
MDNLFWRAALIVEDWAATAQSLAKVLEWWGYEVRAARDGEGALDIARGYRPEVVLLDIGLPGMDGYEFARQFRALAPTDAVRLVALSGYAQPEDIARASEAGFDAHVAKPPDPERLATLLG